jgi:hypothetical protein
MSVANLRIIRYVCGTESDRLMVLDWGYAYFRELRTGEVQHSRGPERPDTPEEMLILPGIMC